MSTSGDDAQRWGRKSITTDSLKHPAIERGVSFEPAIDVGRNAVVSTDLVEQLIDDACTERMNGSGHSLPPVTTQFDWRSHGASSRRAARNSRTRNFTG